VKAHTFDDTPKPGFVNPLKCSGHIQSRAKGKQKQVSMLIPIQRRRPDLNRRIRLLQSLALPLGHVAIEGIIDAVKGENKA
jgi:hypothetical protein